MNNSCDRFGFISAALLSLFLFVSALAPHAALASDDDVLKSIEESEGEVSKRLNPYYLKADFTGDGVLDFAVLINDKLCIYDRASSKCIYASGKYYWADKWRILTQRTTTETVIGDDGDIAGQRNVTLENDSIEICKEESNCKVISIKDNKLMVLHQGC